MRVFLGFVAERIGFTPIDERKMMGRRKISQYLLSLVSEAFTYVQSFN